MNGSSIEIDIATGFCTGAMVVASRVGTTEPGTDMGSGTGFGVRTGPEPDTGTPGLLLWW